MPTAKQKSLPIAIFTHEFYPKKGGIATVVDSMAMAAASEGYKVTVYAPHHSRLFDTSRPYSVVPLPNGGTQGWRCRLSTAWVMLKSRKILKNSLLYLPEPGPIRLYMYLNFFKLISPKRLVLTLHGSEIYIFSKWPHRRYLFNKMLKNCSKVTVLSSYVANLALKHFPAIEQKLVHTPGALQSGFIPVPKQNNTFNQDLNLLTVARIHPRKGHIDVLKAINKLDSETKAKINYQILGPTVRSNYRKRIESYAYDNEIKLEFLGEVAGAQLPQVYAQTDIFIMASRQHKHSVEGFGLVFLEAAASELPVIAYNSGGVAEAVEDKISGILVKPGDCDGLTAAIQELSNNPKLRHNLGQAGKKKASQGSWVENIQVAFEE